jgi:hypothetical protein
MARFLPLLKRRNKENTGTAEAVKSTADETKQNNLTQEQDTRIIKKVIEEEKTLEEKHFKEEIQFKTRRTIKTKTIINT